MTVDLPYPPPDLSPNKRLHWSKRAKATKAYRHTCWALAKEAKQAIPANVTDKIDVHLTFFQPDRRGRDLDGCISRMKAGLDGLADALGVDDNRFRLSADIADELGGFVRVSLSRSKGLHRE